VKSFLPGSTGGLDGLRPQHLKDMVSVSAGEAGQRLLGHLTEFTNFCLAGRVPVVIQPVFCEASLCALAKKDGGIRPIAVGCTLRRLIAKAAGKAVMQKNDGSFLPILLGFGVPRVTEAIVHATLRYIADLHPNQGLLKLDFSNAFNAIPRDNMFAVVNEELSELYPFIYLCYNNASLLSFGSHLLSSDEGSQQGDPLGHLMFCASSMKLAKSLKAEFNVWYLDGGSIGGDVQTLVKDLVTIRGEGKKIDLVLNERKCEIVSVDDNVAAGVRAIIP
jgi:hypothetical protein